MEVCDENVSDIFGRIAGNISESYNEGGIDGVLLDGISAYAGFIGSSAVSEFNETVQGWFDAAQRAPFLLKNIFKFTGRYNSDISIGIEDEKIIVSGNQVITM